MRVARPLHRIFFLAETGSSHGVDGPCTSLRDGFVSAMLGRGGPRGPGGPFRKGRTRLGKNKKRKTRFGKRKDSCLFF